MVKCTMCDGSGLIPLKNKKGEVVPSAWIYCSCHQEEEEHYRPLSPSDFDFPISYDYYRSLCQLHSWPDPGSCDPPEHSIEELHERIRALEERPPLTRQSEAVAPKPQEKHSLELHGGVQL